MNDWPRTIVFDGRCSSGRARPQPPSLPERGWARVRSNAQAACPTASAQAKVIRRTTLPYPLPKREGDKSRSLPEREGHNTRPLQHLGGFTLLEVVTSMLIMGMIVTVIGAAMVISTQAIPAENSVQQQSLDSTAALRQMAEELETAVYITTHTATQVAFTVVDRNGDGLPERIRYAWSGTAGHPLTRSYNGATAVTVVENVDVFTLSYDERTVNEVNAAPLVEGSETLLAGYDSTENLADKEVQDGKWWGQFFQPVLVPGAVEWSVTRVKFKAKRRDNDPTTTDIQLEQALPDNMPSGVIIDSATMDQLSLTDTFTWVEKSFANARGLSPSEGLCLTFTTLDDKSCKLRYRGSSVAVPNAGLLDGDPPWDKIETDKSLLYEVYGTVSTWGTPQSITRQLMTAAHITLQTQYQSPLNTSARLLNTPEVLTAVWEADFAADPTAVDLNDDGVGDWRVPQNGVFQVSGQLVDGIWWTDGKLDTNPDSNFDQITTVDVRLRDIGDDGGTGGVNMRVDRSGTTHGFIKAEVDLSGGVQNLAVCNRHPGGALVPLLTMQLPANDWIDLRLLVEPQSDTVNIQVNGRDEGTFVYQRTTVSGKPHVIALRESTSISGLQWDHARIRVGGSSP